MGRIIDIDTPSSWPPRVIPLVEAAVDLLDDASWQEYPYDHLGLPYFEAEERALRELLADDRIVGYHASRLLPHEIENIREVEGLQVLTEPLRRRKVADALGHFPDAFDEADPKGDVLLRSGPNDWQGTKRVRMNALMFVAPYVMFDLHPWGLANLFDTWGGETLGWLKNGRGSSKLIQRLTGESQPAIIEITVPANNLDWPELLPAFAGRYYEVSGDYTHEWRITESVPCEFVLDIITPSSPRWPNALDDYRK